VEPNIIELTGLTKKYGSFTAVDNLNLTIRKGEIFGLLGPNGAGKSTTILMMLGLTEPTEGIVEVCSINSTTHPINVKRKVGYLPEDVGFYDDRTGLENLTYIARLNSIPAEEAREKALNLLERVGLADDAAKKTGKYSRGMRQRLGLAEVLIKNPEVIILDEPTSGIDPAGVRDFMELIVQLSREEGITVLFSSHHLHQVQQVCDRVGLFVKGRLIAAGNVESLSEQLFSDEPLVIKLKVDRPAGDFQDKIKDLPGVTSVTLQEGGVYHVDCSQDITGDIASIAVKSGVGLHYLQKTEYGLDDIYNRYFEGGGKI
jgi:ABC-2 type transport system ATP-binding protein